MSNDPNRFLIDPEIMFHRGSIDEDTLKARLALQAMEQAGWLGPDGKPIAGVTATVRRGEARKGGYTVEVRRDIRQSNQPRLAGPQGEVD